jgi:hypothetical protein
MCLASKGSVLIQWTGVTRNDLHVVVRMNFAVHNLAVNGS